jgi:arylsulfatase A-like enzyme
MESPNVLLIVLDAVRAKNCSLYDHVNETTPFLEELSDGATVYEQARSPGTNSITSHTSIFTGYTVAEHQTTAHEARIDPESTIWETLRAEYDYATGLFTPNLIVAQSSNLSDPFGTVVSPTGTMMNLRRQKVFAEAFGPTDIDSSEGVGENFKRAMADDAPLKSLANCGWRFLVDVEQSYRPASEHKVQPAQQYADEFLDWQSEQDTKWAACLNFMDAHRPYKPTSEFDLWGGSELHRIHDGMKAYHDVLGEQPWWKLHAIEALYDGGIRQADAAIEQIVTELKRRGEFEDTLLVVTSDHGQGFGERSPVTPEARMVKHSWGVHEVLTHVPLVVKYPNQTAGEKVSELASLQRFPDAVQSIIDGEERNDDAFVTSPVLVSTANLKKESTSQLPDSEMIPSLLGPWRAVYRQEGDTVVKYVKRDGDAAKIRVVDHHTSYKIDESDDGVVDEVYGAVSPAGIKANRSNAVSEEVNEQLRELGYLRE